MPPFVAYHGVDAAEHQRRVDELAPQGFRPTSLSVSGDPADARYAAVWLQRPGPAWVALHGATADQYQARFDELTAQGFAPTLVSATGPVERASFTALFEGGVAGPWFARHHLRWDPASDPDTLTHENQRAFDQGFIPTCLSVYGDPGDRRFAGIWVGNDAAVPWSWWWTDTGRLPAVLRRPPPGRDQAGVGGTGARRRHAVGVPGPADRRVVGPPRPRRQPSTRPSSMPGPVPGCGRWSSRPAGTGDTRVRVDLRPRRHALAAGLDRHWRLVRRGRRPRRDRALDHAAPRHPGGQRRRRPRRHPRRNRGYTWAEAATPSRSRTRCSASPASASCSRPQPWTSSSPPAR